MGAWATLIEGSAICRPFLALAIPNKSAPNLTGAKSPSVVVQLLTHIWGPLVTPFRSLGQRWQAGAKFLDGITWSLLLAWMAWATLADTEKIGLGMLALTALVVLRWLLFGQGLKPLVWQRIDTLVALFFATAVVSAAFSSFEATSLKGLAKFLIFGCGYLTTRWLLLQHASRRLWLLVSLVAMGVAQSGIGLYQYITDVTPLATWVDPNTDPTMTMTRVWGTIQPLNPNLLAGYLSPILGVAAGLGLEACAKRQWLPAVLAWACAAAIAVGIVLTGSRGGFLSIAAIAVAGFALVGHMLFWEASLRQKHALKAMWLLVLLSGVGVIAFKVLHTPALLSRVTSIFAFREDSSIAYRLNVYHSAWRMFCDNWLWGIGPGNDTFKQVYGYYMLPGFYALGCYSVPLEIAVEQGIWGLLSFWLLMAVVKVGVLWGIDQDNVPLAQRFGLVTLTMAMVGAMAYGLFDTVWYRPVVNLTWWILVATWVHTMGQQTPKQV
jgi:putative inorganic carbon (HCO3(-)) transporter